MPADAPATSRIAAELEAIRDAYTDPLSGRMNEVASAILRRLNPLVSNTAN